MTEKIHLTGSVCSAVNNENDNFVMRILLVPAAFVSHLPWAAECLDFVFSDLLYSTSLLSPCTNNSITST